MRHPISFVACLCLALALGPAATRAETVVLRNGTVLRGRVQATRMGVSVTNRDGVLELPRWQVRQVFRGDVKEARGPAPAAPARAALESNVSIDLDDVPFAQALKRLAEEANLDVRIAGGLTELEPVAELHEEDVTVKAVLEKLLEPRGLTYRVRGDGLAVVRKASPTARLSPGDLLEQKVSVDFEQTPLYDALQYVRETTGIGMALHSEVVRDVSPVTLHLSEVALSRVLQLMLTARGYRYSVCSDGALYVRRGVASSEYRARIYPVTDLLLSVEDVTGGSTDDENGSSRSGSSRTAGFIGAQYGGGGTSSEDDDDEFGFSPVTDRAQNLVLLIKQSCGYGTWVSPASTGLIDVSADNNE